MKKIIIFLLLILFFCSFKNKPKDSVRIKENTQKIYIKLDTINFKDLKISDRQNVGHQSNNTPWIISLIIAVLTIIINIWVAKINQATAIRNVKNQIESSKSLALTQFKSNLNTKNRQDWINDVRHCTSDLLSQMALFRILLTKNEPDTGTLLIPYFEKIYYYKNKIALLLNTEKTEQKNLLTSLDKLILLLANIEENKTITDEIRTTEEDIIKISRILFNKHWQKIKIME